MREYIKFVKLFVSKFSGELISGTILASIHMILLMASPFLTSIVIDKVILNKNAQLLKDILTAIIAILILTSVLHFVYSLLLNKIFLKIGYDLKLHIFKYISNLDVSTVNTMPAGVLNYRIFNDSDAIKTSLGQLIFGIVLNSIYAAFICVFMLFTNWKIAVFVILLQSFQVVLVLVFRKRLIKLAFDRKSITEIVVSRTIEILNSFSLVKACRNEAEEESRFRDNLKTAVDKSYRESVLTTLSGELSSIISGTVTFGILWFGGMTVINGGLSIGNLTAFMLVGNMLGGPLNAVVSVILGFQDILASNSRIFEILGLKNRISNCQNPIMPPLDSEIRFNKVNFAYKDSLILENVSFSIKPRTISAIVGRSGTGKTTICSMLARFYDPVSGSITIGDNDIRKIDLDYYRGNMGIVLQNDFMFSGTIRDNIRMGKSNATEEEIIAAAKLANAHEFIQTLPDGYWTQIGERGKQLSGGQAQRISLARLFLQMPEIVILDEATSFVDIESEELITDAILRLAQNATVIIITHKLSTAKISSEVFVLEDKRIIEHGPHEMLIGRNGLYSQLYKRVLA